jgi:hypothetical protein
MAVRVAFPRLPAKLPRSRISTTWRLSSLGKDKQWRLCSLCVVQTRTQGNAWCHSFMATGSGWCPLWNSTCLQNILVQKLDVSSAGLCKKRSLPSSNCTKPNTHEETDAVLQILMSIDTSTRVQECHATPTAQLQCSLDCLSLNNEHWVIARISGNTMSSTNDMPSC